MSLPNDGKLTGENLPLVTLRDGQKVQTGTAARLILSIQDYNSLVERNHCQSQNFPSEIGSSNSEVESKKQELLVEMESAIEPLMRVGLLQIFSTEEWIGDGSNEGRAAFGRLYKSRLEELEKGAQ